jgi:hypothetical protein
MEGVQCDVSGTAKDDAWIVGWDGLAMHYDGLGWKLVDTGGADLLSVWAATRDRVFAVGDGHILQWDGKSFVATTFAGKSFRAVGGSGPDDAWAVGKDGVVMHWDGTGWTSVSVTTASLSGAYLNGVWALGPRDVWIVGWNATSALAFHWDGTAWSDTSTSKIGGFYDVWAARSDDVWATVEHGIAHWDGVAWKMSVDLDAKDGWHGFTTPKGVWGSGADDVWAVGNYAVLHHHR